MPTARALLWMALCLVLMALSPACLATVFIWISAAKSYVSDLAVWLFNSLVDRVLQDGVNWAIGAGCAMARHVWKQRSLSSVALLWPLVPIVGALPWITRLASGVVCADEVVAYVSDHVSDECLDQAYDWLKSSTIDAFHRGVEIVHAVACSAEACVARAVAAVRRRATSFKQQKEEEEEEQTQPHQQRRVALTPVPSSSPSPSSSPTMFSTLRKYIIQKGGCIMLHIWSPSRSVRTLFKRMQRTASWLRSAITRRRSSGTAVLDDDGATHAVDGGYISINIYRTITVDAKVELDAEDVYIDDKSSVLRNDTSPRVDPKRGIDRSSRWHRSDGNCTNTNSITNSGAKTSTSTTTSTSTSTSISMSSSSDGTTTTNITSTSKFLAIHLVDVNDDDHGVSVGEPPPSPSPRFLRSSPVSPWTAMTRWSLVGLLAHAATCWRSAGDKDTDTDADRVCGADNIIPNGNNNNNNNNNNKTKKARKNSESSHNQYAFEQA